MATLNQFLEKALINEGELVGDKVYEAKKPSYANINFKIKLSGVNDENEAMKRAQRFIDDVSSKFSLFNPKGEIDSVG